MKFFFLLVLASFAALGAAAGAHAQAAPAPDPAKLRLASANALIVDAATDRAVYAKGADEVTPIASLTKLMTAIVTIDSGASLDEPLAVDMGDFDFLKGSSSRLSHHRLRRVARRAARRRHGRLRFPKGLEFAAVDGRDAAAPRDAAAGADVVGEPCRVDARPPPPGRSRRVRRGDERQGAGAGDDRPAPASRTRPACRPTTSRRRATSRGWCARRPTTR